MGDRRIIFVSVAPGVWGAERSMLTLAAALRDDGTPVELVCTSRDVATEWEEMTGAPVHFFSLTEGSRWRIVVDIWKRISRLTRRTDTVVLFSYVLAAGAVIPRVWPNGRPSVALDLHDTLNPGRGRAALALSAIGIDSIVAVSEFSASQLIRFRTRVSVLTRPVAPLAFDVSTHSTQSGRTSAAIVGRVTPEKRPELLIEAAQQVDEIDVLIRGQIVAEDDAFAQALRRRGEDALEARFQMEGPRAWHDALHGVDLLVVANDKEPMGRTVLEAQLTGAIAIVPDRGGAAELVVDGSTGFVYQAGDASSLAEAILRALKSDRAKIARNARAESLLKTDARRYSRAYLAALDG